MEDFQDDNIADQLWTQIEIKFSAIIQMQSGMWVSYGAEQTLTLTDQSKVVSVSGQSETPWKTITTFSENQSGYELQFNSPGKTELREINKIKLNYNFATGDVLEIDYSKRRVTLNGLDRSNLLVILQSNYMKLSVGEVEFSASYL